MKIGLCSDLHLEFGNKKIDNIIKMQADVLCLAGDICACANRADFAIFTNFLSHITPKYRYVIHVAGNHEYYTGNEKIMKWHTMAEVDARLKKLRSIFPNYFYLNCDAVTLNINEKKYVFMGATLWSRIAQESFAEIQSRMNDYTAIYVMDKKDELKKFNVPEMQRLFTRHLNFIKSAINRYKDFPCILVTHHKPVGDTLGHDPITQAYETDITDIIRRGNVKFAFHGHTHKAYDKIIYQTRYLSNPKGYKNQRTLYKNNLVVSIE